MLWLQVSYLFALIALARAQRVEEDLFRQYNGVWHQDQGVALISNFRQKANELKREIEPLDPHEPNNSVPVAAKKPTDREEDQPGEGEETEGAAEEELCDFRGQRLRVAVSPQPPLVDCAQNLYGDWLCNGSNIEVIRTLEQRLNFRAEWVVLAGASSTGSVFGGSKPTGGKGRNYTGVVGMVGSGRAWLGANGLIVTRDRELSKLKFSRPFDSFRLHFLLSKSVRDHDHIFIKPFSPNAWLAILASGLLMVPIFYLVNSTSCHYSLEEDRYLRRLPLTSCLWFLVRRAALRSWQATCSLSPIDCGCRRRRRRKNRATGSRGRSSSSSGSSVSQRDFDQRLDKMVTADRVWPAEDPVKLEQLRVERRARRVRRKQLAKQWARERRLAKRAGRARRKSGFFRVAYVVWYVAGSLTYQGGEAEELPRASSARILVAFWWLYLIVICSIHSGILTAILTFPKQNDFIQSLDDFLAIGGGGQTGNAMKLVVDGQSEAANYLSSGDNLHKSPLGQLMLPLPVGGGGNGTGYYPVVGVDFQRHRLRVLDDVLRGQSAFLEEKSTINLIITQEYFDHKPPKCLFKSSKFPIDLVPMSLVLSDQFNVTCLTAINSLMNHIMRTGLAQKWRRKYEPLGNDCLNTVVINAGDVDKIELRHVELAFWLLFAGLSLGALFLVAEVVWLFTADDDEDDDDDSESLSSSSSSSDSSSSSSSSTSGDEGRSLNTGVGGERRLRLGHRRPILKPLRTASSRLQRQLLRQLPPPLPVDESSGAEQHPPPPTADRAVRWKEPVETGTKGSGKRGKKDSSTLAKAELRRRRQREKSAQRRARRLRRTLELMRKLHEGKIYSSFFLRVSGNVQSRARRASQAIVGRFVGSSSVGPSTGSRRAAASRSAANPQLTSSFGSSRAASNLTPIRRRKTGLNSQVAQMS